MNLPELLKIAEAATQGVGQICNYAEEHWHREGHVDFANADLFIASERPKEDAAFYAAFSPKQVIELIKRLQEAGKDDFDWRAECDRLVKLNDALFANERRLIDANFELSQALHANSPLRKKCENYQAEIRKLIAPDASDEEWEEFKKFRKSDAAINGGKE